MKGTIASQPIICYAFYLVIGVFGIVPSVWSQDFGRFPPNISWQQIQTSKLRVVFPKGMEPLANRVANNINYLDQHNRTSIGPSSKKLSLILNNQGMVSNGYVTLAPFRSEFYTTPMQDGFSVGSLPWLDLLSVHEYRHAMQYMNLQRGFTRMAYWLFGDTGWGTMMNLTIPGWYFEGDAVATETALTRQGRGRMPSFLQNYKSILLTDKHISYMKARNGSYRDMVPNEYELGYLLCSYGREHYGNDLWLKVNRQTAWCYGGIYPFSQSLKKFTGLYTNRFYRQAMQHYQEQWTDENRSLTLTPFKSLSSDNLTVTRYRFPIYQKDGRLLVYKDSYREVGAIYQINPDGSEEKICTTGISQDPYFTASGNLIVWAGYTVDERYSARNYSDIILYNIASGEKNFLTHKQRLVSPALSDDGSRIIAVKADAAKSQLVILDSRSGCVTDTLPNLENLIYTYPKWDLDGENIVSSARTPTGSMVIIRQNIATGVVTQLSGEYDQIIGEVLVQPDSILFTSGFSGINNIYSLSRVNGALHQLTRSRFGAYYPAIDLTHKQLTYSDFDADGYHLVATPIDKLLCEPITPIAQDQMVQYDFSYFKTEGGNQIKQIPDSTWAATPYASWKHALNIHSWTLLPGYYSTGIYLISDNLLNNVHAEGGLDYYYNDRSPGFTASVTYGRWYPRLSVGLSSRAYFPETNSMETSVKPVSRQNELSLGLLVPLNFTRGDNYRLADIRLGYHYTAVNDLGSDATDGSYRLGSVSGQASYTQYRKKAYQNITTPLGFGLELTTRQSVTDIKAFQFQAIADFAVSGLTANHNLIISTGYKQEPDKNRYQFSDLFIYPRGYYIPRYNRMFTWQSAYHFPIAYPDFGFWGIFYCTRIRASVFADYGYASLPSGVYLNATQQLGSTGAEIIFDTQWMNITHIPIGFRFTRLLSRDPVDPTRKTLFECIIPVLRL